MSDFSTIQHSLIPAGTVHGIANWIVPTSLARDLLAGFIPEDLHKVCYVQDLAQYFGLASIFPVLWRPLGEALLGAAAAVRPMQTLAPIAGTISLTDASIEVFTVMLTQNVDNILLSTNILPNTAIYQTIVFRQTGAGGFTVTGWPALQWENGQLPVIDTSVGGVSSVELLLGYGTTILGVR